MKKQLFNRTFWLSVLSAAIMAVFIVSSIGSLKEREWAPTTEYLEDGTIIKTHRISSASESYTGKQNRYGQWHGPVSVTVKSDNGFFVSYRDENYIHGRLHGKVVYRNKDGTIRNNSCYNMGYSVACGKSIHLVADDQTSFEVLSAKYPQILLRLNDYGFSDSFVKAYMDSLETLLEPFDFDLSEFDAHYQDAIDDLDNTDYDSLIYVNNLFSIYDGLELLKNSEFRMAVIDRHLSGENHTNESVKSIYPNYLLALENEGINEVDFNRFCQKFDSLLTSYGPLDVEHAAFLDSLDDRMYRAMEYISTIEESTSNALVTMKSAVLASVNSEYRKIRNTVKYLLNQLIVSSEPKEVAAIILSFMFYQFDEADLIKAAMKETYKARKNILSVPTLTTEFVEKISETSVKINGTIIENGGVEVSTQGVVWATFYNPTIADQLLGSDTGSGDFDVVINGLSPSQTYYARTFATNSVGTAYGNCISFVTSNATNIDLEIPMNDFSVYPNPASTQITLEIRNEVSGDAILTIVDVNGREVLKQALGNLTQENNKIQIDISNIKNGVYYSLLKTNSKVLAKSKFVIVR